MWLNCVFGGKGVGLVNMLVYIIVAVFIAGLMVGRTPEYLGKKIEAREMKLAMIALLIHPHHDPAADRHLRRHPPGARRLMTNPAAHGFSEILYQFSSSVGQQRLGLRGPRLRLGLQQPERPTRRRRRPQARTSTSARRW